MLKSVKKRLKDVQDDLFSMIDKNTILIGHSLNSDLHKVSITIGKLAKNLLNMFSFKSFTSDA